MLRALLVIAISLPAIHAQSWEAVRALHAGDRIKVEEIGGPGHKGAVTAVTADSISIESGKKQLSFDRARIGRVEVKSSKRRLRNLAIGAGIGLAVGIVADQTIGRYMRNEVSDSGRPLFYVVPIGAALAPYQTIYHVK